MAGQSGSSGDQHVWYYPNAQQSGPYRPQSPTGARGRVPSPHQGHPGALLGNPAPGQHQPVQYAPNQYPPNQYPPNQYPPGQYRSGPPPGRRRPARRRLIDYPRSGRRGLLRWIPSWQLLTGTSLTLVLIVIIALLAGYAATPMPPVKQVSQAQTTTVYYSDGKTVLTKFAQQNRTIVPLSKMSADIRWAVISAEDRTFYANKGVSPVGIVRAAWNNVRGGELQGGSTITQQYVKNSRIGSSRTWHRKIREFFIAIRINNEQSKDQILENYLNTIYFGRNTYGIQAAAQAYFGKGAAKLTLAESAYLAGILNGPELYDTRDGEESVARAKERFHYVLDGLVELGRITPEQRAATNFEAQVVAKVRTQSAAKRRLNDQTRYLEQMIKAELPRIGMTFEDISSGGYKVVTTFDKKLMDDAVEAIHDPVRGMGPRSTWPKGTQVGLVSLDPRTGAVRAIYGGDGLEKFASAATQDRAPAGSIYKPFTLLAALEGTQRNGVDGIGLRSRYSGSSPFRYDSEHVGTGSPLVSNFGGASYGMIDLVKATASSVNTVYARLNQDLDAGRRTMDAALRAGISKEAISGEVSNTLGNGTPTVAEMASAYGTIAAGGVRNPYYVIQRIESSDGAKEYVADTGKGSTVFNKDVVADATYAMQQVVRQGTARDARRLNRPVAGKTGTVGTTKRESKAAWFVGFTPQLSTAVGIHRIGPDGKQDVLDGWGRYRNQNMTGGMFPLQVWTEFMDRALDGEDKLDFPDPAWVGEVRNPAPRRVEPSPSASVSEEQDDGAGEPRDDDGNESPGDRRPDGQDDARGDGQDDGQGGRGNDGGDDQGDRDDGQADDSSSPGPPTPSRAAP